MKSLEIYQDEILSQNSTSARYEKPLNQNNILVEKESLSDKSVYASKMSKNVRENAEYNIDLTFKLSDEQERKMKELDRELTQRNIKIEDELNKAHLARPKRDAEYKEVFEFFKERDGYHE